MGILRILSSAEQVAEYLRGELANRSWTGVMPGGTKLAKDLGVGVNTMEAALKLLEDEGLLVNQGRRRGRVINSKQSDPTETRMRICVLLGENTDRYQAYILELINALEEQGHAPIFASQSLDELGDDMTRVSQLVKKTPADAWIVCSATQGVLQWFSEQRAPCFALAGRANHVKIPSTAPDKITPLRLALKRLVELGHRRIVHLCRPLRRIPEPGRFERAFIRELENLGIQTGPYNLPNWDDNVESFHRGLDSLFSLTPPTAVMVDESMFVPPILQFSSRRGLRIPEDFSLIATDPDPFFAWCQPSVAHISWDSAPMTRRIVQWVDQIAHGREDYNKGFVKAKYVEGGSVGPAPGS